jgi:hypothetical protein
MPCVALYDSRYGRNVLPLKSPVVELSIICWKSAVVNESGA